MTSFPMEGIQVHESVDIDIMPMIEIEEQQAPPPSPPARQVRMHPNMQRSATEPLKKEACAWDLMENFFKPKVVEKPG